MNRTARIPSPVAVSEVFRPIVRLLKASGIADSEIVSAVTASCRDYRNEPVRGLWLSGDEFMQLPDILSAWMQDTAFTESSGEPCKLHLSRQSPSFQELVKKAGVAVPFQEALRQLKARGAVQLCDRGKMVRLVSHVLFSARGRRFLSPPNFNAIRRLAETIENNVLGKRGNVHARMQRSAYSLSLNPKQFQEAERFVRLSGQTFLDTVDEKLRLCSRPNHLGYGRLYGVGIYTFIETSKTLKRRLGTK